MKNCPRLVSATSVTLSGLHDLPAEFARPLRRCDTLTRTAVAAVYHCIGNLKYRDLPYDFRECAIFTGLGTGTLETNLAFVDSLFEKDGLAGSPTMFSHSVHNTVAGYISRLFDVRGPSFTVTDFAWPFITALQEAQCFIAGDKADIALVVTADTQSPFIRDMQRQIVQDNLNADMARQCGAAAWLITGSAKTKLPGVDIEGLYLHIRSCSPEELLLRLTERYPCADGSQTQGPLGYIFSLDQAVQEVLSGKRQRSHWHVESGFGKAGLSFHKS